MSTRLSQTNDIIYDVKRNVKCFFEKFEKNLYKDEKREDFCIIRLEFSKILEQ